MERKVVVTGMGVITPVGNDVETFWNNIISGVNGIAPITRFDTTDYAVKIGAEVKDFDPTKYMEKSEVRRSDHNVHMAVAAAAQAVEDSGIEGNFDPERAAVYFGSGIGGIETFENNFEKLLNKGPRFVSPYFIPMMIPNMAAGTIAIRYGMRGPALPSVSACASGTNAIGEALRLIRHGYADVVITDHAPEAASVILREIVDQLSLDFFRTDLRYGSGLFIPQAEAAAGRQKKISPGILFNAADRKSRQSRFQPVEGKLPLRGHVGQAAVIGSDPQATVLLRIKADRIGNRRNPDKIRAVKPQQSAVAGKIHESVRGLGGVIGLRDRISRGDIIILRHMIGLKWQLLPVIPRMRRYRKIYS